MYFTTRYLTLFVQSIPFLFALMIFKYYFDKRRLFKLGSRLPGPRPLPIIGNALDFQEKDLNYVSIIFELNKKYEFAATWIGHHLYIHISSPEDAEIYFTSRHLLEKSDTYRFLEPIFGKGLVTAKGAQWKKARKLIEPAFGYSSVQGFIDIYQKQTNVLLQCLKNKEGKGTFSIYPYIKYCTFDIISEATMPFGLNAQQEGVEILEHTEAIMDYTCKRIFNAWQQCDFIYKLSKNGKDHYRRIYHVQKFTSQQITAKKISYNNSKGHKETSNKKILLERLIDNEEWTDDELRDHIVTIIAAGYETSASAICFTLMMLGIHQDVQEKLYRELSIAIQNGLEDKDLYRVEYLDMVIKETLRLYPTVPYIFRKADEDVQMGNNLIPKGASVALNFFALHRNSKVYENPEAFDPDRFLPENVLKRHPYSFVPFSMGNRMCIGSKFAMTSIKIIISKIVCTYKIECDLKVEDIKVEDHITLRTTDGLYPVRIINR